MLAVMLFPVAGSADSALACYLDRIEIYPEEATIPAGNSITYTAEAFNYLDQSMGDVTPYTTFSIEYEAGGYWSPHNTYNSENVGTWVVTGEYEGKVDTAVLIVELTSGSISGVVFNDIDGDGVRDGGEAGIDGVIVKLDGVVTVTTSGGGLYNFSDLVVGLHDVEATVPPVYVATTPNPVNDVYVGAGGTATVDFGFQGRGNISGVVFNDIDGDGVRDGGEAGIDGVTVKLDGVVTVTTSGGGLYSFIGVAVGDHNVAASTPTGYVGTTPNPVKVTVVLGITVKAYFGFRGSSSICGVVFNDIDGDGVRDGGEAGIDGVTVTLDSMRTVTTSGGGLYSFIGVVAGLHDVESGVPTGYVGTTPNPVNDVYVGAGGTATVDFGFQGRGSISGIVFDDENGNGVQESGELGIGGVTVTLDGVVTTSTGGDGIYSFSDIEAGLHDVESGVPAGYAATTPNPVNDVYVGAGGTAAVDFGFQIQADLSIGKWADSESVVAGEELTYTVEITNNGPSDASGVVVRDELPDGVSLVSADGGSYSGGIITWDIGDLASGASTTRTVVVTVNPGTPQGTLINEVEVDGNEADPNPENNTAEEETAVTVEADLRITKTDISETVAYGSGLTYEITVTNDGPSCSRNVEVRDAIPSGTEFKSATATKGSAWHEYMGPGDITGVVFWSIGDMDPGTSVTLTLVVTVLPTAQGTIINTAEVYSAAEDPDPNHENNTATEETALPVVDHIIISSYTNNITAGESLPYTATAYDEYGTSLGDVTSATIFSINPEAGGNWSPTNIYNSEKAGVWKVVGNYEGKEDDETLYVKSGPLDHFVFGAISSPQAAGVSFTIIIKAKDACGNTLTGYTDTADLSDDTGTIKAVTTGGPVTGHFVSGVWTGKVIITATATDDTITATDDSITGESNEFDVEPGPHDHFVFDTILSPQAAGVPFTITITAVDAYGNTVTDYTDTADLSDGIGTIAPIETGGFTAGVWTGEVTITAAATDDTITATDDSITGESNEFNISSGKTVRLELRHVGSDSNTVGTEHTLIATAYDDEDNPVLNEVITWTIVSGPSDFVSKQMITDENGEVEAVITSTLVGDTVVKASVSETVYDTATKTWTANELDHFRFDTISSPQAAGVPFTITITAVDVYGNIIIDYTDTADLSDDTGTIEPDITANFVSGVWMGEVTIAVAHDDDVIAATDGDITGESNAFDVEPGPMVSGFVFDDTDRDGVYDIGDESGIGGVTVELFRGETVVRTTLTAGDGSYSFLNVTPGNYWVVETNLPGYKSTTPDEVHVNVVLGEDEGVDFGDVLSSPEDPAVIYGTVFNDADGNGEQDDGEPGIPDVTVTLDDTTPKTTDEYGRYTFRVDVAGAHTVVETDPIGYFSTTPNEVHVGVTLGESYQVDFGDAEIESAFAVIYGTVFNDADGNSIWDDGEVGIPGVTVTLDNTTSKTTDEYGRYTFRVDDGGAHTVVETDPIGYTSTTNNEVDFDVVLGNSYIANFGDRIQPPPRRLGRIVISPETASISAGDTQTYTVKAYDTSGASMGDVTSSTTFSIQVGAGGSWSGNTYTSENVGRWTVTATYSGKSDTATLTVVASPINGGENEGPEEEEPEYFTVDFLGEITRVPIGDSGELLETLQAPSPDGRHLLEIQQGTIVVDSEGNVVTLIEIREAEKPGLPANTTLLGDAYDFQPSGIMFSIPASATLGYDLDDLPENVVSVALACYTDELGWTEFASQGGVVAELGRETAEIDHFTIFAVLARTATGSAPSIDQAVADFLLNNLAISLSRSEVWEFLTFVVTTGEDATITVEVMNIGGKGGNYTAFLKLDGVIVATQKVSLEPGQTETITFNIGPNEPGTYQVEVGGLHGEFESSVWINWGLVLGLPAGLILLALLLWYLRKRQKAQAE
jgi:uncharacterized repeat protein (TIGR01451 family)